MDGIGGLQAALVISLPTVGWKLLRLGTVQVGEGPGDSIAGSEVLLLGDRLEETPTHNLETLLGASRSPCGLETTERVAQAHDGLATALATNLNVGGRDAGYQERLRGRLGSFSERLGEAEVGVEGASREAGDAIELAHVGHPLVDQDQAGGSSGEELAQHVRAGTHALPVSICHQGIPIFFEELPGEIAPECAHHGAIRLSVGLAR